MSRAHSGKMEPEGAQAALAAEEDVSPMCAAGGAGMHARRATLSRTTSETAVSLTLDLDGTGAASVETGIGFFDHMLEAFARHGLFDLDVHADGDLHVDGHHTVEDVGIVLGTAFSRALGDKRGVRRFGSLALPMDEALVMAAVDLSGRGSLHWNVDVPWALLGGFDSSLAKEFFIAFAANAGVTLHVRGVGENAHHIVEAAFKACARAMRAAVEPDPRAAGALPSTKGLL